MPVDRQSKRLTEKTLLQKQMTKIDIAYRIKVSKTAVFPDLFFFLTKLLRNQTTRTDSEKHWTKFKSTKWTKNFATKRNL